MYDYKTKKVKRVKQKIFVRYNVYVDSGVGRQKEGSPSAVGFQSHLIKVLTKTRKYYIHRRYLL